MIADEMLEKLGFVLDVYEPYSDYSKHYLDYKKFSQFVLFKGDEPVISFDLDDKTFFAMDGDEAFIITVPLFQAIHQKMKELGWIE